MSKETLVNLDDFSLTNTGEPPEKPAEKTEEELATEAAEAEKVKAEEAEAAKIAEEALENETPEEKTAREAKEAEEAEENETEEEEAARIEAERVAAEIIENETEEEKETRLAAEEAAAAEESKNEASFKPFAQAWFSENGWDWNDDLLEEDSMEGFNKLLTKIVAENSAPDYANEETQRFDEFIKDGGDAKEFFEAVYSTPDYDAMSIEDPVDQRRLMKMFYKDTTKYSDEKINKEIKRLENTEELETEATEAKEHLKARRVEMDANLEKEQEKKNKINADTDARIRSEETADIMSTEEFLGLKPTRKEKENFAKYLFDTDRKTGKTGYQEFLVKNPNFHKEAAYLAFKKITAKDFDSKKTTQASDAITEELKKFSIKGKTRRDAPPVKNPKGKTENNFKDFVL